MNAGIIVFPIDLCLGGKIVLSMEEVLELLRRREKGEAYELAMQLLDGLTERHEYVERLICILWEFIDEKKL